MLTFSSMKDISRTTSYFAFFPERLTFIIVPYRRRVKSIYRVASLLYLNYFASLRLSDAQKVMLKKVLLEK